MSFIVISVIAMYSVGFVISARCAIRYLWGEFPENGGKVGPGIGYLALMAGFLWPVIGFLKLFGLLLSWKMKP